jgi:purine-binding chemotaxis protein CheW
MTMGRPISLCTFRVADQLMGLPALRIQEVLRSRAMTPVPLAPQAVLGLVNLRGQIVTAVDLRQRLGFPRVPPPPPDTPADEGPGGVAVVVDTDDGLVSLMVDDFGDVTEVDADDILPPPATLTGAARRLARGVLPVEGRLVLVLDVDRAAIVAPDAEP